MDWLGNGDSGIAQDENPASRFAIRNRASPEGKRLTTEEMGSPLPAWPGRVAFAGMTVLHSCAGAKLGAARDVVVAGPEGQRSRLRIIVISAMTSASAPLRKCCVPTDPSG